MNKRWFENVLVSCWFTAWPHYYHHTSFFCFLFWALLVASFWTNTTGFGGTRCWVNTAPFWAFRKMSVIRISHSFFLRSGEVTWLQYLCASVSEGDRVRGKLVFSLTWARTFLQRDTASKVLMRTDCVGLICDAGIHPSACFILAINRESSFFK